jgi:hypothetical protein
MPTSVGKGAKMLQMFFYRLAVRLMFTKLRHYDEILRAGHTGTNEQY